MRDSRARARVRALDLICPWTRRRPPGRDAGEHPASRSESLIICTARVPALVHILARSVPSPRGHRISPWALASEAADRRLQRCVSPVAATTSDDVPFRFEGSAVARAGVSA